MSIIVPDPGCEGSILAHVCTPCAPAEAGRISSLAAIHKDYYDTLMLGADDPTVWTTGITTGKILIFPEVRGSKNSAPALKPGYGRVSQRVTGREHKLTIEDPNWLGNHAMYNALQDSRSYHVAYVTETKVQISQVPAFWLPDEPIEDDEKSERAWKIDVSFSKKQFPIPVAIPDGVFTCFTLG